MRRSRRPLPKPGWLGRGDLRRKDLMSRSRRAARWLQPGLVVKRWVLTSGLGLLVALLGAAVWAEGPRSAEAKPRTQGSNKS